MGRRAWVVFVIAAVIVVAVAGIYIGVTFTPPTSTSPPPPPGDSGNGNGGGLPPPEQSDCPRSVGLCEKREVTRVIDGDTLEVQGGLRIRLVLVDAPELSESGGPAARDFLTDLCLESIALIDEDDFQIGDDPFGRTLAVVYCDIHTAGDVVRSTNANAAMISSGHADTYSRFCSESEFESQAWTGCSSPPPPPPPLPPQEECDPAYPTVCIPSPPPDLDCGDIPYTNFEVLPPDPHNFDGDGDGIGCET